MSYTFQSTENTEGLAGSSKICSIIDGFMDYEKNFPLAYGKIQALFGQPFYETENLEDLFSYNILAKSEDGEEVYLNIYCAGSGPSIGGKRGEASEKAAKALVDYIWQADPVDYDYKGYYMDGPTALELGIKNGVPYFNEVELELSDEEFERLYAKLYGL